mmetsp:Transcript_87873/g.284453  ORF Transcript_87873/g.284453 Transcript_87873/m.284453 type:complete len:203 (+) Transcript_87873:413-1021(+)
MPASLEMSTTRPYFCSWKWGQAAFRSRKWPTTCVLRTVAKSSRAMFWKRLSSSCPAFATTMSIRPKCRSAVATTLSPPTATLLCSATAVPPMAAISATTSSAFCGVRLFTTTLAPRAASSRQYARPRPRPPPVTIATRPSKRSSRRPRRRSSAALRSAKAGSASCSASARCIWCWPTKSARKPCSRNTGSWSSSSTGRRAAM